MRFGLNNEAASPEFNDHVKPNDFLVQDKAARLIGVMVAFVGPFRLPISLLGRFGNFSLSFPFLDHTGYVQPYPVDSF